MDPLNGATELRLRKSARKDVNLVIYVHMEVDFLQIYRGRTKSSDAYSSVSPPIPSPLRA